MNNVVSCSIFGLIYHAQQSFGAKTDFVPVIVLKNSQYLYKINYSKNLVYVER